jgi:hypothetical protein
MLDLEARAEALCAAPAGCAFLLIIEESGLTPEAAARPVISVDAAAIALSELNPFRVDHDWIVATALPEGPRLIGLARALLSQPAATWLFAPLDRSAQLWVSANGASPDPSTLVTPSAPPSSWERYAQKPAQWFFTSTVVEGGSSHLAAVDHYAGDWSVSLPVSQYLLNVSPAARVFEVDGPDAWHRLCAGYPATGDDGRLVPDWSTVSRDWDGVHLSLGGLLTSEQVRVESVAGWSEHWAWNAELTLWLRRCFTAVQRLPDLTTFPRQEAIELHWPRWIWQLQLERIRRGMVPGVKSMTAHMEVRPRE